ncbi:DUF6380 family protein [Streptomyces sp. NPDC047000]|uniref:DUF6380 family protein n=1 Tax=Streptomyces sp. NPDC047000 TaxID=3155474 RepID=UPI0033E8C2F0
MDRAVPVPRRARSAPSRHPSRSPALSGHRGPARARSSTPHAGNRHRTPCPGGRDDASGGVRQGGTAAAAGPVVSGARVSARCAGGARRTSCPGGRAWSAGAPDDASDEVRQATLRRPAASLTRTARTPRLRHRGGRAGEGAR